MTTSQELLKTMLQDLINDRPEQAEAAIHSYIVAKTQQVAGFSAEQAEAPEAVTEGEGEGKYGLMLCTGDKEHGWYVSDDTNVSKSHKKAAKYSSMSKAKADAKTNNSQWDLKDGQSFTAKEFPTV